MNPHLNKVWRSLPHIAGALAFLFFMFIGTVVYQTWIADDVNLITMNPGKAEGFVRADGDLEIKYQRGFVMHSDGAGVMHRRVVCTCAKTGVIEEYDFPSVYREFKKGGHPPDGEPVPIRYLISPIQVPETSRCTLFTYANWRGGLFAIGSRLRKLDELEFTVQKKP